MKRFILPVLILFCYPLFAQTPDPGMMPRWGRFKDYLQNGTMTFTYKTLTSPTITGTVTNTGTNTWSGTGTFSTTLKVVGNSAATNFYVVSDADSFKVRMFKYLYPIEIEIGNVQKFAVDSAGNAIFAGTVSASAFSPTATSTITAHEVFAVSDGDTVMLAPHQDTYMLKVGVGGARKFSVDSAGWTYATSFSTPTAALTAITGSATNATAVSSKFTFAANYPVTSNTLITTDSLTATYLAATNMKGSATNATAVSSKLTIAADYPFVSNSTVTVDSLVTPRIAGVLGATEVKSKLTIAANYPLVSSAGVTADSLSVTAGNMTVIDIDSVATAGGANRWLKITVSKAGATGIPVSYWVPADTATVL